MRTIRSRFVLSVLIPLLSEVTPVMASAPATTQPTDRQQTTKEVLFVYALHNTNAVEAARVLRAVFRADREGATQPAWQAAADAATNSVVVSGTDVQTTRARRILEELDAAAAADSGNADAKLDTIEAQLLSLLKDVRAARAELHAKPQQRRADGAKPIPAPDPPRPLR